MTRETFVESLKESFCLQNLDKRFKFTASLGCEHPKIIKVDYECVGCMATHYDSEMEGNWLQLTYLRVYKQQRGVGARVLDLICRLADQHQVDLFLYAVSQDEKDSIPDYKLIFWYKKYGFVRSTEKGSTLMERKCKTLTF